MKTLSCNQKDEIRSFTYDLACHKVPSYPSKCRDVIKCFFTCHLTTWIFFPETSFPSSLIFLTLQMLPKIRIASFSHHRKPPRDFPPSLHPPGPFLRSKSTRMHELPKVHSENISLQGWISPPRSLLRDMAQLGRDVGACIHNHAAKVTAHSSSSFFLL